MTIAANATWSWRPWPTTTIGAWRRDDVAAALAACDRTRAGPTAPPQGLTLREVRYDVPPGTPSGAGQAEDTDVAGDDE